MKQIKFRTLIIIWLSIFLIAFVSYIVYDNIKKENKAMVSLTFQYFENCPNSSLMLENINLAIQGIEDKVNLSEVIINTDELASKYRFRGSPTLLIDGNDLENMIEPLNASLSCRVYKNNVPSVETIKKRILEEIRKNQ